MKGEYVRWSGQLAKVINECYGIVDVVVLRTRRVYTLFASELVWLNVRSV